MSHNGSKNGMSPEVAHYNSMTQWCRKRVSSGAELLFDPVLFQEELYEASKKFQVPFEGLHSLFRNSHLVHVKRTTKLIRSRIELIAEEYTKGSSILNLAIANNYPPYMLCRILLDCITTIAGKKSLTDALRDPMAQLADRSIIQPKYRSSEDAKHSDVKESSTRLAFEVTEAIDSDPMYGPRHDRERHDVGIEYERRLEEMLTAMDVPFESEAQLRERGTSRTPDVLLSCPMGVPVPKKSPTDDGWKVICWIDSKALFGDVNTHHTSVLPQAESYVHRFGPGLVLYWFGHAPLEILGDAHGDIVMASERLPIMLFPTGELAANDERG